MSEIREKTIYKKIKKKPGRRMMNIIKFKCCVITPMFMAGADGKTPELRPSEFKGMMRFWWRAIRADDNIEKLKEEEAKIFGGTGEKEGKSKVMIKVCPQPKEDIGDNIKNDFNLQWQYNRNTNSLEGEDKGIGYLLYSATLPRQERKYIKPNFQFNIELSSHNEESFNNALASLWAAIYLGGFGTRARRGAGNIIVEAIDGSANELDFVPKGNTTNEVFKWLISNLNKCFSIINNGNPKNFCTKYSNLSFSRIIISNQSFTDWKAALNDVGKIYAKFRTKHKNEIFDTAVFGLPVVHRNRGVTVKGIKGREEFSRRSSPIIFKIIKSGEYYFWYVIRLSGEFLEEGAVIKAHDTQKPDYKLIDKFWNDLKNSGKEFVLSEPKILNTIIEKIKTKCNPDKIILFGSRARGDAHQNADIDIAVEGSKNPISNIDITAHLDIVDFTRADPSLKDKIEHEGVTIYERKG
jgi:CRISPR-associated protein Cmr1